MFYITVFDEEEQHLGWIDSNGRLTTQVAERSGFSSKKTADDFRFQLETENPTWYTEIEE